MTCMEAMGEDFSRRHGTYFGGSYRDLLDPNHSTNVFVCKSFPGKTDRFTFQPSASSSRYFVGLQIINLESRDRQSIVQLQKNDFVKLFPIEIQY